MQRKVDPQRIILNMSKKICSDCNEVQYAWFKTTDEFVNWTCPYCMERLERNEDNNQG